MSAVRDASKEVPYPSISEAEVANQSNNDLILSVLMILLFVGIFLRMNILVWGAVLAAISSWSLASSANELKSFWSVLGLAGMSILSLYLTPNPYKRGSASSSS